MPGQDQLVEFEGKQYSFPSDAGMDEISKSLQTHASPTAMQPGAMQTRPGGPILNAANFQPSGAPQEGTMGKIGRGGLLGMAEGAGIPETQHPVMDLLKNFLNPPKPSLLQLADPTAGGLSGMFGLGKAEVGSGKETYQGIKQRDPEMIAHGVASGVTRPAMMLGGSEKVGEAVTTIPEQMTNAGREILGEGPSKYQLKADLHEHAMRTQAHVQQVAESVHSEAQNAMASVAKTVDEAKPEGTYPKADIQARVKEAVKDLVKTPEAMPASVNNILKTAESKATSTGPRVMGGHLDLSDPTQLASFQRMKAQGMFSPEEVARMEGKPEQENWTHEQLTQFRSDVGRDLGGMAKKGVIGAATNAVYGILSDALRKGAESAGVGSEWLEANAKYKQYMDDFVRGPARKVIKGTNASQIMQPLTGNSAIPLQQTLSKYADHGINMDAIQDETRRYSGAQTVQRFSRPGRLDLIMAGISPKIAALRVGLPRLMRNPETLSKVFGKGFEDLPDISAKKVALKQSQKGP